MPRISDEKLRNLLVFFLLVAIGVAGRWAQPEWCFTPISATAVFAGYFFARWPVAVLVPLASVAISDLILPAYDSLGVMLVAYAALALPVVWGRMLRGASGSRMKQICRWATCGFVPATVFYLATNFAVWAFRSNYEASLAGLMQCYWAAIPFYRWMLAGDLFYLAVLFGCYALAGYRVPGVAPVLAGQSARLSGRDRTK